MSHFIFYTLYYFSVQVVDNHRISVTLRESVFMAQELALQGMSAKEIKTYLEEDAYNSSIYIAVNTLDYLKKVDGSLLLLQ